MAAVIHVKSGLPPESLKTNPLTIQKFNKIAWTLKNIFGIDITERKLALITYKIKYFLEIHYGKSADKTVVKSVRLPQKLFRDYSENGSLSIILKIALEQIPYDSWADYDVVDPKNVGSLAHMISYIETTLVEKHFLKRPIFFLSSGMTSSLISELASIAVAYQGTVVDDRDAATHVVCWDEDVDGADPEEMAEDFIRPIELRPNEGQGVALVHWWYYPDSYDEWIPSIEVECRDVPEDPAGAPTTKQWRVCCRFIRDVVRFNEWGNELDYEKENETDTGEAELSELTSSGGRKSGRGKRKPADKQRRVEAPILEAVQVTEKMLSYLPPPTEDVSLRENVVVVDVNEKGEVKVTKGSASAEHKTEDSDDLMEEGNTSIDMADRSTGPSKKRKEMESSQVSGGGAAAAQAQEEEHLLKRKRHLLLSTESSEDNTLASLSLTYPSWYSPAGISTVELRYLPEVLSPYFISREALDGSRHRGPEWVAEQDPTVSMAVKTNHKYLITRNYIVDLYRENPDVYLSATECRQKIAGDVGFIIRIHEFLDAFEIINSSPVIKASSRPLKSAAFYSSCPTASQIEAHCSAFRSSTSASTISTNGVSSSASDAVDWTPNSDSILLKAISGCLTALKQGSQGSDGNAVSNIDWKEVSRLVTEATSNSDASSSSPSPSPQACFKRFVEMSLTENVSPITIAADDSDIASQSRGTARLDNAYVHKKTTGGGWNGTALSKKLYSAAAVVASECAGNLDYATAIQAVNAANAAVKGRCSTSALIGGGAAAVSAGATAALTIHKQAMGDVLEDYVAMRLVVLEEKMKLIREVDKALELERDRIELDRRDLQVQRAELAFYQP